MKEFWVFVRKEFYHILRDRRTMMILLIMPVVMIILFGFALTTEVRNVQVGILAAEPDDAVHKIAERLEASEYFTVKTYLDSPQEIDRKFRKGELDMVLVFEDQFSDRVFSPEGSSIQLVVDATNASMAQSYTAYTTSVVAQYYQDVAPPNSRKGLVPNVILMYNPQMKSSYNFVPGIMGLTLMLICALMTSIAIVKEKETGTMEVLLVSPLRPIHIIIAKMIPYFTVSCINLLTILLLSIFVLKVPVAGSIVALSAVSLIYIVIALSLGLLVSTLVDQQIIAMLFSSMLLMVPTILLCGMIFPIESMPEILQYISHLLPPKWYIMVVRKLMIAGLPVSFVWKEIVILIVMAVVLITISLRKFNNRLE
ncbi:ABC transporter permease [Parabacteroides sp. OttesenSCG-928-G06]|nr:ABC transporter permease [Parabacteroides sp. OttesenSCG-928-G06]